MSKMALLTFFLAFMILLSAFSSSLPCQGCCLAAWNEDPTSSCWKVNLRVKSARNKGSSAVGMQAA
jgi:hypothetical protein